MNHRQIFFSLTAFLLMASSLIVCGQTKDSLIYRLDNDLFSNDREKYDLLRKLIVQTDDAVKRLQYCDQAIRLAGKLKIHPAQPYIYKGNAYLDVGILPAALECFIKAAEYYRISGSKRGVASAYQYIVEAYTAQGDNNNVKDYLRKEIDIYRGEKDTVSLATALHNLGYAEYTMGQYDTALVLFSATSKLFEKLGYKSQYAYCIGNSGLAYSKLSEYEKAEDHLVRAIEILTREGDIAGVTEFTIEYAGILQHKGNVRAAIDRAGKAYDISVRNNLLKYRRDAAKTLAGLYRDIGRYDSAFSYQSVYISANDSLKNVENVRKMARMETEFEVSKMQSEVQILQKNKLVQRIVIVGLAIILLLALGLILLYSYSLKRQRKMSATLDERRLLLEKQSAELKEKNDSIVKVNGELEVLYSIANNQKEEIISSINYAERIQHALLQREDTIDDAFILFLPKDIVSGDFYWFYQKNDLLFIAAVDCTGHGVPGAFMSIIGQYALNKVIREKAVYRTADILDQINIEVMETLLHHDEKAINDGMDISIVAIDMKNMVVEFSGAFSPLYVVSNGKLEVYKGDKFPIGKITYDAKLQFTSKTINVQKGDMLYLFSDGFADQVGYFNGRKYMSKNVQLILADINKLNTGEQKYRLEKEFFDWKGDREQVDDVLFIGKRIS